MAIDVYRNPAEFRAACDGVRESGKAVGFVPTLGGLHRGHATLVEQARRQAEAVFVSVFLNPTQFGPTEDLAHYPQTLEADTELAERAGAIGVFAPAVSDLYPPGEQTRVVVGALAKGLCGAGRPGHFEGVATIVSKLFCLTGPCIAFFGRKDYQQLKVVQRLVSDLLLPVHIVGVPTVREADGLALSTRNGYLSADARQRAAAIPRALSSAFRSFHAGERNGAWLKSVVEQALLGAELAVEYVSFNDPESLEPWGGTLGERVLLAVAARVGGTRLIDNVVLGDDRDPLEGVS